MCFSGVPRRGLDDAQILLPGEVAVIAGALDEAPHLPQDGQAVAGSICLPSTRMLPALGRTRPRSIFSVVDLPAPLGPRKP